MACSHTVRGWVTSPGFVASRAVALVLPCVALVGGLLAIRDYRPPNTRYGGTTVNGRDCGAPLAVCVDRELAHAEPEVVVVGNSLARTDLDVALLAQGLGTDPARIVSLSVPGSSAPLWLALADRVFRSGDHPRWLLLVGDLRSALEVEPRTPIGRADLDAVLGDDSATLRARLGASTGSRDLDDLASQRVKVRQRLLDLVRNGIVGLAAPPDAGPAWGKRRADRASRAVFADRDLGLAQRAPTATTPVVPPERGLLPELFALGREHGARVVLVRPPLSPRIPPALRDAVPAEVEARVAALAGEGGFLDASRLALGLPAYADVAHLAVPGARTFTAALTARLTGPTEPLPVGLQGRSTFPTPPPALVPRSGEPGPAETTAWAIPQVGPVWTNLWSAGVSAPADCLPVQVSADGVALPLRPCGDLFESTGPGACFDGTFLFARPPARLDAADLRLVATSDRACGELLWLYPGDQLRLDLPTVGEGVVRIGASSDGEPALSVGDADGWLPPRPNGWPSPDPSGTLWLESPVSDDALLQLRNDSPDRLLVLWHVSVR